jgi:hypothetical protein
MGFYLAILLCGMMLGIITLLILILDPNYKAKDFPLFFQYLGFLSIFSSILLQLFMFLCILRIIKETLNGCKKETFNGCKLETIFPEEWQADLKTLQERWMKQSYSCQKIRVLTIKHIFHMGLGYIQIQLENIWLPNNASTKEIE